MKSARIVTMSKQMVDSLLAMNTKNRGIKKSVVERYARDMVSGKWPLTCQGIGVSEDEVLIDGQHRLEAMKLAGYPPIEAVLVTGLDFESQMVTDQHTKRSARDVFRLAFNASVAHNTPAILQVIAKFEPTYSSPLSGSKSGSLTMDELYSMFTIFADEIEAVCEANTSSKFFAAPYLAAAVYLMNQKVVNKEMIGTFFEQVKTGENLSKKMPAFHLRNYVLSTKTAQGGNVMQKERYLKTRKAIAAFASGEEIGVLRA